MANPGDRVRVKTNVEEEEGILMPSSDDSVLIIKLDNGYNMGFEKKDVLSIRLVERKEEKEKEKKGTKKIKEEKEIKKRPKQELPKKKLPTVYILHCGGTIASKVDYETGAVKAKFSPTELLEMFSELGKVVNLDSKPVANMFSEDMRWEHYNLMAKEIEEAIKEGAEGVIITQGTDFLHYTSAALAFALENLSVPVLVVGSQRSSDRGSSDAAMNLLCAAQFIVKSDFGEVAICMHQSSSDDKGVILPACKSRKLHTSRRDAFKAINTKPWAYVSPEGKIDLLRKNYRKKDKKRELHLKLFNEKLKLGIIKAHPSMSVEEIKCYHNFDGVILEGGGIAGNFPINVIDEYTESHARIYEEIKVLAGKIPVVATSQCLFGRINMNVYSTGRKLKEAGVLGNLLDITTETALVKLAWLLSNYNKEEINKLWYHNFRGEFDKKGTYEEDFLK